MRDWYERLAVEMRAAIVGGLVQGTFLLVGILLTAWIASVTVTREVRLAQMASGVGMLMDGMAEADENPTVGGPKVAAALAILASHGPPKLVFAMAELRRCTTDETVLHFFQVIRSEIGAGPAETRDLMRMYDVTPDKECWRVEN